MKGITLSPLEARDLLGPRLEEEISGDGTGEAPLWFRERGFVYGGCERGGVGGEDLAAVFSSSSPPLHCKAAGSHGPPKTEKGRRGKWDRFASPLADAVGGGERKGLLGFCESAGMVGVGEEGIPQHLHLVGKWNLHARIDKEKMCLKYLFLLPFVK